MKLIKIAMENFRSFKGKHEIEFAPITLLFGGNSVGKSSITKAIQKYDSLSDEDIFHGEKSVSVGLHFVNNGNSPMLGSWGSYGTHEMILINNLFRDESAYDFFDLFVEHLKTWSIKNEFCLLNVFSKKDNHQSEQRIHKTRYSINGQWLLEIIKDLYPQSSDYLWNNDIVSFNLDHPILQIEELQKSVESLAVRFTGLEGQSKAYAEYLLNRCLEPSDDDGAPIQELARELVQDDEKLRFFMLDVSRLALIIRALKALANTISELEHLGPLRAIPDVITSKKSSRQIDLDFLWSNKKTASDTGYAGEQAWGSLSSQRTPLDRHFLKMETIAADDPLDNLPEYDPLDLDEKLYLLNEVNEWLLDWFNTPYQIKIFRTFSLEVDSEDKKEKLIQGQISKADLVSEYRKIRFLNVQNGSITSADEIGVGISQLTPVIVNAIESGSFSVEQPELHIHPKMQTIVADLFVFEGLYEADEEGLVCIATRNLDGTRKERTFTRKRAGKESFILVETHSEHLMLRLLKRMREGILKPEDLAIYYFENDWGKTKTTRIKVDDEGEFTNMWPGGFFEERLDELF